MKSNDKNPEVSFDKLHEQLLLRAFIRGSKRLQNQRRSYFFSVMCRVSFVGFHGVKTDYL